LHVERRDAVEDVDHRPKISQFLKPLYDADRSSVVNDATVQLLKSGLQAVGQLLGLDGVHRDRRSARCP
jgi:hypothetical protein